MAKIALATLKGKFQTGDLPTGADFTDLIDTLEDAGAFAIAEANLAAADAAINSAVSTKADVSAVYTKAETDSRIQVVVGAAPAALDTLQEIAAQLAIDQSATAALVTQMAAKVDKTPITESKTAPAIAAGALTINCANGNVFAVALNANVTSLTLSGAPASGTAIGITVALTADGTARTITWPASVKWAGGTAPTLTSTAGKVDIFVFCTWDGGTTWYAHIAGQNM
jgi:hypothetical protein